MKSKNGTTRRDFLRSAGTAGLLASINLPILSSFSSPLKVPVAGNYVDDITWIQQPLPYSFKALEPYIDAQTMEIHFGKHAATYAKNLSDALKEERVDIGKTRFHNLLASISKYSAKMLNNAGGHYNHELFWRSMQPPQSGTIVPPQLAEIITRDFNSLEAFKAQFSEVAKSRFGSGWAWLIYTNEKKLVISSTPNQENPLMDLSIVKGVPVLGLDVWEHAYYLKYQNKRVEYIKAWWNLVNWNFVREGIYGK